MTSSDEGLYRAPHAGFNLWQLATIFIFIPAILYYIVNRYVFPQVVLVAP
jgi:hypothetical protein